MNESKRYEQAKAELNKVFKALGDLERQRETLVAKISSERVQAGDEAATALLDGKAATTATANKTLEKLEKQLVELDGTMQALTARWSTALKAERQAAQAIHTEKAKAASAEADRLRQEADRLTQQIIELNAQSHDAAAKADEAGALADQAGRFLKQRVGLFKGAVVELKERLGNDPCLVIDRNDARALLAKWETGEVANSGRTGTRQLIFPETVAVFFDNRTGKILENHIVGARNAAGKLAIGVRTIRPELIEDRRAKLEQKVM